MDGTWNVPKHLTNVSRLAELLTAADSAGIPQHQKYVIGIGTSITDRLRGAFGKGINDHVWRVSESLRETVERSEQDEGGSPVEAG